MIGWGQERSVVTWRGLSTTLNSINYNYGNELKLITYLVRRKGALRRRTQQMRSANHCGRMRTADHLTETARRCVSTAGMCRLMSNLLRSLSESPSTKLTKEWFVSSVYSKKLCIQGS